MEVNLKIFFLKDDPCQYVIYPQPLDVNNYHVVVADDDIDLSNYVLNTASGEPLLQKIPDEAILDKQRQQIRDAINTLRDKKINGGVYVSQIDKWVDTDEQGRSTLVEMKADFDLNGKDNTYTLICADNTARVINFDEFKAVWDAVKTLKEKMFENAYMHKVLLEHSDDPLTYDWSIGWSKTYAEHLAEVGNE